MLETIHHCGVQDEDDWKVAMTNVNEIIEWSNSISDELEQVQDRSLLEVVRHTRQSCLPVIRIFQEFYSVLSWLYQKNGQNVSDFRLLVEQHIPETRHRYKPKIEDIEKNTNISIICLNAGFIFNDIKKTCSSIILTSGMFQSIFALRLGTLSPLKSFATEMNVDFQFTIEALSSIDVKKQVIIFMSCYF